MSLRDAKSDKPLYKIQAASLQSNKGQWDAYESTGNCVILAGPGSGKTKTLTIKMARMLAEDIKPPRGIACITYNNQCVRELKRRLRELGISDGRRVAISTLHTFCLKHIVTPYAELAGIPKKYPFEIASEKDIASIQQQVLGQIIGANEPWRSERFDKYRRTILDRSSDEWRTKDEQAAQVVEAYERSLDERGLIDFEGMVLMGLYLVESFSWVRKALVARFPILVVDEYQDLGYPLDRLVQSLCFDGGMRLLAVGDPDQSIYGFTGAEPKLLENLSNRDGVHPVQLKLNYRCGSQIIHASKAILTNTPDFRSGHDEPGVVYFKKCPNGLAEQVDHIRNAIIPEALGRRDGRKLGDIAILYIDKNDGDVIADAIAKTDWDFVRVDSKNPYKTSPVTYWLEDCAAWCAGSWETGKIRLSELIGRWFLFNERLDSPEAIRMSRAQLVRFLYNNRGPNILLNKWLVEFWKTILHKTFDKEPQLSDDKTKVENLLNITSSGKCFEKVTVSFFGGQGGSPDHLNLTTLHSAKGLEYDVVVMVGLDQGRIPWSNDSSSTLREKRRLFYVGLTRARHEVHLLCSGWHLNYRGEKINNGPSQFFMEVYNAINQDK